MQLQPQLGDLVKVVAVDVSVNPENPLKNRLDQHWELLGEWGSDLQRENVVVVKEPLDPVHQVLDVLARGQQHRTLARLLPQVLVFLGGDHPRTRRGRAKLGDRPVQHVDLVVEVDGVDGQPLVDVLVLRELHCLDECVVQPEGLLGVVSDVLVAQHLVLVDPVARAGVGQREVDVPRLLFEPQRPQRVVVEVGEYTHG